MEGIVLGCGEAFDDLLPNTSLLVQFGSTLLLDCGFSAVPQVWKNTAGADQIDAIYISHAHADHYFGMPALLGRMWEESRTKPLQILSQAAVLDQLRDLLELGYRGLAGRFNYEIEYRPVAAGQTAALGDACLYFAPSTHSASNLAVRIEAGGKVLCYSGDGMFTDAGKELFSGAGLLVHEAYSFDHSPVHADIGRLMDMAERQSVQHLALVHVQRTLRRNATPILDLMGRGAGRVSLPDPGTRLTA
jgi:ribonuclease Z